MFKRIIKNDIKNSKLITCATLLIITAASILGALAVIICVNLFGSIDTMMTNAKTPHFMQMHQGDMDEIRMDGFAKDNPYVEDYQVLEFLNVDGDKISINGLKLTDNIQDNGFSVQSNKFDYLLDLEGNIVKVSDGDIYLPTYCLKEKMAKVGDKVLVGQEQFTVKGFFRDSQMNSSLASSKRYLISENDYKKIECMGSKEYLIEFRLKQLSDLKEFQNDYIEAGLEANGPTITYPLFRMINAISDGMMIGVIFIIAILILFVAFMCIRFTLLAKIEDEYREIGVMKAIGLSVLDIKKIYLAKYALVAMLGCLLGFILSYPLKSLMLKNIHLHMGKSNNEMLAMVFSVLIIAIIFLVIIMYVNAMLKRFKKISAVEAMRGDGSVDKASKAKSIRLSMSKYIGSNVFMGIKDVFVRKKLYFTMLIVFVLSMFIMVVPLNIYNTISAKEFVTYMGIGNCHMRIDSRQSVDSIVKALEQDEQISQYSVLETKSFVTKNSDGSMENIKVELGNHSAFPVMYSKGNEPALENEIALSSTNAEELGKKVGDSILLYDGNEDRNLVVCGIYSDITNGGKTAKAAFTSDSNEMMWNVISIELKNSNQVSEKVTYYSNQFGFAKVSDISEYVSQTFGTTKASIKMAMYVSFIISIFIAILVTALFMKMLVAKDKYQIAVMKALGFANGDIRIQYVIRAVFVLLIGILVGTILANTLGEMLSGLILSSLGADTFKFIINPIMAYFVCPMILVITVVITALISTRNSGKIKIADNIKE